MKPEQKPMGPSDAEQIWNKCEHGIETQHRNRLHILYAP